MVGAGLGRRGRRLVRARRMLAGCLPDHIASMLRPYRMQRRNMSASPACESTFYGCPFSRIEGSESRFQNLFGGRRFGLGRKSILRLFLTSRIAPSRFRTSKYRNVPNHFFRIGPNIGSIWELRFGTFAEVPNRNTPQPRVLHAAAKQQKCPCRACVRGTCQHGFSRPCRVPGDVRLLPGRPCRCERECCHCCQVAWPRGPWPEAEAHCPRGHARQRG